MKVYVYISDTKVDMLYSQIDRGILKKIAAELRIDLKILGAEVGATLKKDQIEQTRYSKLQVVVKYIEKKKGQEGWNVGTVNTPEAFFKGTLPMHWGPMAGTGIVYFTGSTKQTILGLGGSLHHVIGNNAGTGVSDASSALPALLTVLAKELRLPPPDSHEFFNDPELALMTVEDLSRYRRGPGQQLEFLATKYLSAPSLQAEQEVPDGPTQVLLGSPIYVALAV